MMYSRLRLARNLMRDDGVIFISINHREIANIRKIADEIFGEDNMLCLFAWRTDGNFDNQAKFKYCHEYVIAYAKQEATFQHPLVVDPGTPADSKIFRAEIRNTIVKNGPKNPASAITLPVGFPASFEKGSIPVRKDSWPHVLDEIHVVGGRITESASVFSGWSSRELLEEFIEKKCEPILDAKGQETVFEITSTGAIEAVKVRGEPSHVISMLSGFGGPQKATAELVELGVPFDDYPKPVELIKYLSRMVREKDFIALDFFSGSATTAHAILKLNAEDDGCRRFIMVQLAEPCDESSEAFKAGYRTIAEIGKDRIRLAGQAIDEGGKLDVGFRVFKIDTSNMADVYYAPDALDKANLDLFVENIKSDRGPEDLLFQVMLDWGLDLALPIAKRIIQDKEVFFVDENALVACFDATGGVDEDFVKALAKHEPLRVVFRDAGFKNSAVPLRQDSCPFCLI